MQSLSRVFRGACAGAAWVLAALTAPAAAWADCPDGVGASTRFIQFPSPNIATNPPSLLTIKGKLSYPGAADGKQRCLGAHKLPAVLILHGSSGVDSRGDFYQQALNAAGFITLQIDMWEARGVTSLTNRPAAPIFTYPDAYSALAFLAGLPEVDAERVGVLGFSWGGVISLASAERLYTGMFGGGRKFAAHVAHYPVCYGANNTTIPALQPPSRTGTQLLQLTGAPVLIQVGTNDDYDNGSTRCQALAAAVNPSNNHVVQVQTYPGAFHAWDRIMVPVTAADIFANEGSYFATGVVPLVRIVPDVDQAHEARRRVVRFFKQSL
ncbi:MAG: dienelactone hydrolase family protein [Pseudomonadota bacterium]